jgi:DNA-binding GntR family transcriptional regulator
MAQTKELSKLSFRSLDLNSSAPVREQTVQVLRGAILNLELKPGQRLIEREFINRLGISRTTFREALRELTSEGLVTVVPQKGARVSKPSIKEAGDLFEIRAALESLVVTRFTQRATESEVASLVKALDDHDEVVRRTTNTVELLESKEDFYRVLFAGAHSQTFEQVLNGIKARVRALRSTSLSKPGRPAEAAAEMRAVVNAIIQRDAGEAARLNTEHIHHAVAIVISELRRSMEASDTIS